MTPALAMTSILLFWHPHLPSHLPAWRDPEARKVAGWTVRVRGDAFSGGAACRISRGGADYQRQALVFHLRPTLDTQTAVYRIDGGPARRASQDQADLAKLGFALHNDDLINPSGGIVRIPVAHLAGAHAVRIETAAGQPPVKFHIEGWDAALAAAKATGCGEADFQ